jgi:uncharacterized protein (TIGR00369 family)
MDVDPSAAIGARLACPYGEAIGVALDRAESGGVRLRLDHRGDNANRNGTLHGGVIASLAHFAGTAAASSIAADAPPARIAVADLSMQFLAAAVGTGVLADARVVRRGREFVFAQVGITSAGGQPIALALLAARLCGPSTPGSHPRGRAAEPGGIDAAAIARLAAARFSGSPFSARLRIASARYSGGGHVVAVLPWQGLLADADGCVHEGAMATLVDAAGGAAAWAVEGWDARGRAATIAMHLTFGTSTRDEDVVALARPAWRTGEVFSIPVDLLSRTSGEPLATASVTYRIVRP